MYFRCIFLRHNRSNIILKSMLKISDDEGKVNIHVCIIICTKLYKNTIVISEEPSKNGEIKTWLVGILYQYSYECNVPSFDNTILFYKLNDTDV